jgi:hypothetical protein
MMSEETTIPQDFDLRRIVSALLEALTGGNNPLSPADTRNIIQAGRPQS